MILDRQEFTDYWNALHFGFGDDDSPLWIPEREQLLGPPAQWFLKIRPASPHLGEAGQWTRDHLGGIVRCYSSSEDKQEEWWGFTEQNDIEWFLLRWGR